MHTPSKSIFQLSGSRLNFTKYSLSLPNIYKSYKGQSYKSYKVTIVTEVKVQSEIKIGSGWPAASGLKAFDWISFEDTIKSVTIEDAIDSPDLVGGKSAK